MDFHGLNRKKLQELCKKHGIPANLKNVEMADRLSSLLLKEEIPEKAATKRGRSCLKNVSEDVEVIECDKVVVGSKEVKKVRFTPENQTFLFERTDPRAVRLLARKKRAFVKSRREEDPIIVSVNLEESERLGVVSYDVGPVVEPVGKRNLRRKSVVISEDVGLRNRQCKMKQDNVEVVSLLSPCGPKRSLRSRGGIDKENGVGEASLLSPCVAKRGTKGKGIAEEGVGEEVDRPQNETVDHGGNIGRVTRKQLRNVDVVAVNLERDDDCVAEVSGLNNIKKRGRPRKSTRLAENSPVMILEPLENKGIKRGRRKTLMVKQHDINEVRDVVVEKLREGNDMDGNGSKESTKKSRKDVKYSSVEKLGDIRRSSRRADMTKVDISVARQTIHHDVGMDHMIEDDSSMLAQLELGNAEVNEQYKTTEEVNVQILITDETTTSLLQNNGDAEANKSHDCSDLVVATEEVSVQIPINNVGGDGTGESAKTSRRNDKNGSVEGLDHIKRSGRRAVKNTVDISLSPQMMRHAEGIDHLIENDAQMLARIGSRSPEGNEQYQATEAVNVHMPVNDDSTTALLQSRDDDEANNAQDCPDLVVATDYDSVDNASPCFMTAQICDAIEANHSGEEQTTRSLNELESGMVVSETLESSLVLELYGPSNEEKWPEKSSSPSKKDETTFQDVIEKPDVIETAHIASNDVIPGDSTPAGNASDDRNPNTEGQTHENKWSVPKEQKVQNLRDAQHNPIQLEVCISTEINSQDVGCSSHQATSSLVHSDFNGTPYQAQETPFQLNGALDSNFEDENASVARNAVEGTIDDTSFSSVATENCVEQYQATEAVNVHMPVNDDSTAALLQSRDDDEANNAQDCPDLVVATDYDSVDNASPCFMTAQICDAIEANHSGEEQTTRSLNELESGMVVSETLESSLVLELYGPSNEEKWPEKSSSPSKKDETTFQDVIEKPDVIETAHIASNDVIPGDSTPAGNASDDRNPNTEGQTHENKWSVPKEQKVQNLRDAQHNPIQLEVCVSTEINSQDVGCSSDQATSSLVHSDFNGTPYQAQETPFQLKGALDSNFEDNGVTGLHDYETNEQAKDEGYEKLSSLGKYNVTRSELLEVYADIVDKFDVLLTDHLKVSRSTGASNSICKEADQTIAEISAAEEHYGAMRDNFSVEQKPELFSDTIAFSPSSSEQLPVTHNTMQVVQNPANAAAAAVPLWQSPRPCNSKEGASLRSSEAQYDNSTSEQQKLADNSKDFDYCLQHLFSEADILNTNEIKGLGSIMDDNDEEDLKETPSISQATMFKVDSSLRGQVQDDIEGPSTDEMDMDDENLKEMHSVNQVSGSKADSSLRQQVANDIEGPSTDDMDVDNNQKSVPSLNEELETKTCSTGKSNTIITASVSMELLKEENIEESTQISPSTLPLNIASNMRLSEECDGENESGMNSLTLTNHGGSNPSLIQMFDTCTEVQEEHVSTPPIIVQGTLNDNFESNVGIAKSPENENEIGYNMAGSDVGHTEQEEVGRSRWESDIIYKESDDGEWPTEFISDEKLEVGGEASVKGSVQSPSVIEESTPKVSPGTLRKVMEDAKDVVTFTCTRLQDGVSDGRGKKRKSVSDISVETSLSYLKTRVIGEPTVFSGSMEEDEESCKQSKIGDISCSEYSRKVDYLKFIQKSSNEDSYNLVFEKDLMSFKKEKDLETDKPSRFTEDNDGGHSVSSQEKRSDELQFHHCSNSSNADLSNFIMGLVEKDMSEMFQAEESSQFLSHDETQHKLDDLFSNRFPHESDSRPDQDGSIVMSEAEEFATWDSAMQMHHETTSEASFNPTVESNTGQNQLKFSSANDIHANCVVDVTEINEDDNLAKKGLYPLSDSEKKTGEIDELLEVAPEVKSLPSSNSLHEMKDSNHLKGCKQAEMETYMDTAALDDGSGGKLCAEAGSYITGSMMTQQNDLEEQVDYRRDAVQDDACEKSTSQFSSNCPENSESLPHDIRETSGFDDDTRDVKSFNSEVCIQFKGDEGIHVNFTAEDAAVAEHKLLSMEGTENSSITRSVEGRDGMESPLPQINLGENTSLDAQRVNELDATDDKMMLKRRNRSVLIHGTARKPLLPKTDMKENMADPKRMQMVNATATKPVLKRKALQNIWK